MKHSNSKREVELSAAVARYVRKMATCDKTASMLRTRVCWALVKG